jgi:hypothetical protein
MIKVIDRIKYLPEGTADRHGLNKQHNRLVRDLASAYRRKLEALDLDAEVLLTGTVGGSPAAPQVEVESKDPEAAKKIRAALSS